MKLFAQCITLVGLALLTIASGAAAIIAPVTADNPVVSWPQADHASINTMLPLAPERPLRIDASVSCATLRSVDPTDGTALRSQPQEDPSAKERRTGERDSAGLVGDGMRVGMDDGRVTVAASGVGLVDEILPSGRCTYRVVADESGVRILRDGTKIAEQRGLSPPEVSELTTDADGTPAADGLAAELNPDARYQSVPSTLKIILLVAHALLLGTTVVLAWLWWSGSGARLTRPRWSLADGVAVLISGAWIVLGPMNMDDSWYLLMARNTGTGGFVGNYIYMSNSAENPFVLSQYLLHAWGELGDWSLWWMRVVPAVCGLVTWLLLRIALTSMLGRAGRVRLVPWALLVAHLLWFLPYGISLRPEPVIVVLGAATLMFTELARLRESVGVFVVATMCAALAVTVSPSGVVAAAPLVIVLPWLVRWLRGQPWSMRIAAVVVAAAAATVVVPVGFADASLGEVLSGIATNNQYYDTYAWYEEFVHYETLLDKSGWARRLPVLLTLALLVVAAIASGRGGLRGDPFQRLVPNAAIMCSVAFCLIALTPTKWVNHFHVIAPVSTVLIAGAFARSPLPRQAGPVIRSAAILVTVTAVSLAFAGANYWAPYSDAGQLFGDHTDLSTKTDQQPHIGPIALSDPLPWLAVVALALAWARIRYTRGKPSWIDGDRAVLATASVGSIALLLASFVWAPISQGASWTVARSGIQTLLGNGCGLANDVKVAQPSTQQLGTAISSPKVDGDFVNSRPAPLRLGAWDEPARLWHDDQPDGTSKGTGTVVTGWQPIPTRGGTHVTLPVAGAVHGQVVKAQFGAGDLHSPRVVSTHKLQGDPRQPTESWQQLTVKLPKNRPATVRFVVSDVVTGADSWLAVSEPKLTELRPVTEITNGETVFADQISAGLWPCVRQARIANGITETPAAYLGADEGIRQEVLNNPTFREWGGAWTQTAHSWVPTKLHSELRPAPPPRSTWGQVFKLRYPYPTDRYDLRIHHTQRGGLTQLPSFATPD